MIFLHMNHVTWFLHDCVPINPNHRQVKPSGMTHTSFSCKTRYLEPFLESFFYFWTYLYHSWSTAVSFVSFNRQLCHFYIFRCLSSKRWFSLSCIFRLHPSNNCWLPPIETSWSQLDSEWWRSWAFGNYKKLKLITEIHQNESNTIQNDILTFSVKISCCIVL